MAKERYVTRKIVTSRDVIIYNADKMPKLEKLAEVNIEGRVSEKQLAKEYNVDKVVVDVVKEYKTTYGVPVDEFMKKAKVIATNSTADDETENNSED